jgi:hypothetical protein
MRILRLLRSFEFEYLCCELNRVILLRCLHLEFLSKLFLRTFREISMKIFLLLFVEREANAPTAFMDIEPTHFNSQ